MKRVQHNLDVRSKVLEVSRQLFFMKGYCKTTIKEITKEAGITTGSLYHFFRDKEDILLHITQEVFDIAAAMSDAILGDTSDPWLRFSLEIGFQFHFILCHKPIAELYLVAHESGQIATLIARSAQVRNQKLFQAIQPGFTSDDYYIMSLAIRGIIHSFLMEAVHGNTYASPAVIFRAIEMALLILQIPSTEIDKTIQATHELIKKNSISIYDLKILLEGKKAG